MKDFSQLKESLGGILNEAKEKKKLADAQQAEKNEADRRAIFESVGKDIGTVIGPYIEKLKENSTMSAQELKRIISEAVKVDVPAIDTAGLEAVIAGAFAGFTLPTPQVNITVPDIHIPAQVVEEVKVLNWPERMKMLIDGIDMKHPLPVLVVDETGKPFYGGGASSSGGGGPRPVADIFDYRGVSLIDSVTNPAAPVLRTSATVTFPSTSIAAALVDSSGVQYSGSNPLPVAGSFSLSAAIGPGDAATAMRVVIAGNSDASVSVTSQSAFPVNQGDVATALRVVLAGNADASVVVNSGTLTSITNTLTVQQLSGAADSVSIVSQTAFPIAQGDSATALRVVLAGNADSSVVINGITGPIGTGDAASALRVVIAGNSDSSVSITAQSVFALNQGDTDARTLRVVQAGDSASSVMITGQNDSMLTYMARTTNPTAKSDGADVRPITDKLGRPIARPIQVRDLIATAYATLSNGTETTILAAGAATFLDLIWIGFVNTSTAAVQVDIRAGTAGNIVNSVIVPAQSTAGWAPAVPWPQDATGNTWTADMGDFTNSNVLINALFSKEI